MPPRDTTELAAFILELSLVANQLEYSFLLSLGTCTLQIPTGHFDLSTAACADSLLTSDDSPSRYYFERDKGERGGGGESEKEERTQRRRRCGEREIDRERYSEGEEHGQMSS